MSSIFEKIANREIPSYTIWESDTHMAFLTIAPVAPAHTLVIPKKNLGDELYELSAEDYQELMAATQEVAKFLKVKQQADRVISWVEGFEVPHVHVHLLPVKNGFSFGSAEPAQAEPEELAKIHAQLTG